MTPTRLISLLVLVAMFQTGSNRRVTTPPTGKVLPEPPAIQTSEWGHIVWFETGWADDTMAVMLDVPTVNPGCRITDAGYALNPKDPGVKVHEAAIMGAYFSGRRVRIRAQGCAYEKPLVIAVAVTE
jgi:hypothetical protein